MSRTRVGVLLSGSGSNLQALIDACQAPDFPAEIVLVVSNRQDAFGLQRAEAAGIDRRWLPHRGMSRQDYDEELVGALRLMEVEVVCLAGFMRIVTPTLLDAFPGRVMNIHPALLPAFPGLHGQAQALSWGVTVAGATVHLVDAGTDTGPILCQGVVPALQGDDEAALQERILRAEHRLYPLALRWLCEGRVHVEGRRARVDLKPGESRSLFLPAP